ncbi:MAG: hypothetical protein ACFFFH_08050 [Candidatus Thorarchaeota archaeon]
MTSQNDNLERIDIRVLAKFLIILYLIIPYIFYFLIVLFHPYLLLEHLKWLLSNWFPPMEINLLLIMYWSPVLIIIGGVSYIARISNLSRIPINSSIFDAITLPTIQYGPIKIIFPIEREEPPEKDVD